MQEAKNHRVQVVRTNIIGVSRNNIEWVPTERKTNKYFKWWWGANPNLEIVNKPNTLVVNNSTYFYHSTVSNTSSRTKEKINSINDPKHMIVLADSGSSSMYLTENSPYINKNTTNNYSR